MLDPRQGSQESSYCFEVPIFLKSVVVVFFCWFPRRIWKMLQIIPYLDRSAAWMKKIVAPPKATKLQSNDLKKKTLLRSKLQKNYLKRRQKAISILLSRKVNRVYDTIVVKQGNEVNFAISLLFFTNFKISLLSFHLFDGKKQTFSPFFGHFSKMCSFS